jgi:fucose permease
MNIALIFFSYLSLFCLGFIDNSRGAIYPSILSHFSIGNGMGSLIFSIASLASFTATIFARKWLFSIGLIKATHIGLLSYFLGCFVMWLSSSTVYSFGLFLLGSFIFGLGLGIHGISLNLIIGTTIAEKFKRRVFSGLHAMYGMASLIAPFFVQLSQSYKIIWSEYVLLLSLFPILISSLFFKLKNIDYRPKNNTKFIKIDKRILSLITVFSLYITGEMLISSRLVVYLVEVHEFKLDEASGYLSGFFILLLVGRLSFSLIHIKISNLFLMKISLIISSASIIMGIFIHPGIFIFSGLGMSFFFPTALDFISNLYKEDVDSVLSYIMIGVGACLVINHLVFGQLVNFIGMKLAISLVPLFHIIAWFILIKLKQTKHNIISS